jgi:hypothetical protein
MVVRGDLNVRNLRLSGAYCGFLDDEGASGFDLARDSEVLDLIKCSGWQSVQPDTVLSRINHPLECGNEAEFVRFATDNFEHRFLDTMAVCLADLGDLAEPHLALGRSGVDVIGDQEVHDSGHRPRQVLVEVGPQVPREQTGLDQRQERGGHVATQVSMGP